MRNRNAAIHLLLVVSILLCAFIYAGYWFVTRGDAGPSGETGGTEETLVPDIAEGIPAANGDELSLTPPAGLSMRPPPAAAPVVASGGDSGIISGLVPDASGDAGASASAGGMMPGASLPVPGFSFSPAEPEESGADAATQSPPVLALPGMGGAGDTPEEEEDFGVLAGDEGDFASLPGFDDDPGGTSSAAPVLTPPPAATTTLAPPPASAAASSGTGTALRPPAAAETVSGAPPPPVRTTPPPPPPVAARRTGDVPAATPAGMEGMDGMSGGDDPEFRSDSLRIYVVAHGDTLSSIAMRELGSGFLADNIFLLNRDVIDDPNHLAVGMKIRLPYANPDASGGYGDDPSGGAAPGPGAPPGRRPTQGLGSTHTVARGDTLSSIALQYYGSSAAWQFLYEANRAIVPNPNQLTVGMELSVPPYGE